MNHNERHHDHADRHRGPWRRLSAVWRPLGWLAKLWGVDYPLGCLLPILFPKLKPKHVILIGCLCSIATEATQYMLKMGWCETDDVIHNTLGTTIGVWVWLWQSKRLNAQRSANPGKGEV